MKCPACFNKLTEIQVGAVRVDVCQGGCGGIWFDAFELQQVDESAEAAGELLLEIQHDETVVLDTSRKRECPRCENIKLKRHFFSAKRRVEVDECPNCGGYWLDAGELAAVRAEKQETATAVPIGRATVSAETIRNLYRLKIQNQDAH